MNKVTIVIPVYNGEEFIDECINSALDQTYKDIEIIVVNDGSTDNTLQKIHEHALNSKIKIINKKNGGCASALNTGIRAMTGDWFKWLSADDVLKPHALESMMNIIDTLADKENHIFYTHYDRIDGKGNLLLVFNEPDNNHLTDFEKNTILFDHFYGNGSSSLIHKSLIDKIGLFSEVVEFQEDYDFWLRASVINGFTPYLINTNSLKYRVHKNQLTGKNVQVALLQSNKIRDGILQRLNLSEREQYKKSIKEYQKTLPKYYIRKLKVATILQKLRLYQPVRIIYKKIINS